MYKELRHRRKLAVQPEHYIIWSDNPLTPGRSGAQRDLNAQPVRLPKRLRDQVQPWRTHEIHRAARHIGPLSSTVIHTLDVTGVSPFVRSIVMLKTEPAEGKPRIYAPFLAGVDPESLGRVSIVPGSIVAGSFDLADNGLSSAINRAEGLPRSILKHLPNRALEPITKLFQGLQGDVLVPVLHHLHSTPRSKDHGMDWEGLY
jgi:hypothetical protein